MKKLFKFFVLFSLLSFPFSFVHAYTFGKNKVQYRDFDWKLTETEHFRIFYYPEIQDVLPFASAVLEEAFDEYCALLGVNNFSEKIPVLIYSSPNAFKQTNVTLEIIDEFTGGFTELFKNRVVVPFNGSWSDFKHVLRHELVHVFQFNIFLKGTKYHGVPIATITVPLWFMEGMAEYLSWGGWSSDAVAYMRDLLFNEKVVPVQDLENYGGYIVYKEGQAIFCFIEEQYGTEKVREFIHNMKLSTNVSSAFKRTLGKTASEVNEEFMIYLKRKFFKDIQIFEFPTNARRISSDQGFLNFGVISPDGGYIALLSDRSGFTNIYLVSAFDGHIEKKLVSGERSPSFENLHLVRPGFAFSPDGKSLIFPASKGDVDVIYIVDISTGKSKVLVDPGIEAIYEPTFSPDGKLVAFTGITHGQSDIFVYDIEKRELKRITNDRWDDRAPHFSVDGRTLLFASDRQPDVDEDDIFVFGSYGIFAYSFEDSAVRRISPYFGEIEYLWQIDDSTILFTTWFNNSKNVLAFELNSQKVFLVTNFPTEVRLISTDTTNEQLAISLMWGGKWSCMIISDFKKDWQEVELEEVPSDTVEFLEKLAEESAYRKHFTLDWIQGTMAYESNYGLSGWMVVGLSDELGNSRFVLATDRFSDNTNLFVSYSSLEGRMDWAIAGYSYWDQYYQDYQTLIYERHTGLGFQMVYPFDKFKRMELTTYLEYPRRYTYTYLPDLNIFILEVKDYFSIRVNTNFVIDRALYTVWGPMAGDRGAIEFERSFGSDFDYNLLILDYRWYWRTGKRSTWAWRLIGARSWGKWRPSFWAGGYSTIRGYPPFAFNGNNLVLLNSELRVPFIDRLSVRFPIPFDLTNIRGVVFFDLGRAWSDEEGFRVFREGEEGIELEDLAAGVGYGFRLYLAPGVALRFDIAKKANFFKTIGPTYYYLSIDFDY
ncbi:MAG: hypothetical protein DRQ10_01235 [Candidatus Hydrothermota bacterium]|nr:MAG: hypothetical protein DRQ10_01235 [Candidatus Hydrothermae bacterium]